MCTPMQQYCLPHAPTQHNPHRCSDRLAQSTCHGQHDNPTKHMQIEIGLRVQIATLEQQLQDSERQKAALEVCVLELAKLDGTKPDHINRAVPFPNDKHVEWETKLRELTVNNEALKASNQQLHVLLSSTTRAPEVGKGVQKYDTTTASTDTTAIETSEPEPGEIRQSFEQEQHTSLSSSFASDQGLSYIERFQRNGGKKYGTPKPPKLRHSEPTVVPTPPQIPPQPKPKPEPGLGPVIVPETLTFPAIQPYAADFYASEGKLNLFKHPTYKYVCFATSPSTNASNYRTIVLSNLPIDLDYEELLAQIHGGTIISANIMTTPQSLTKSPTKSALVTFEAADAANKYVDYVAEHPLCFGTHQAIVTLVKTATWPTHPHIRKAVFEEGATRCFELRFKTTEVATVDIQTITEDLAYSMAPHLTTLERIHPGTESNAVEVRCTSVKAALAASKYLLGLERYKDCKVRWMKDPCAREVQSGEDLHRWLDRVKEEEAEEKAAQNEQEKKTMTGKAEGDDERAEIDETRVDPALLKAGKSSERKDEEDPAEIGGQVIAIAATDKEEEEYIEIDQRAQYLAPLKVEKQVDTKEEGVEDEAPVLDIETEKIWVTAAA